MFWHGTPQNRSQLWSQASKMAGDASALQKRLANIKPSYDYSLAESYKHRTVCVPDMGV